MPSSFSDKLEAASAKQPFKGYVQVYTGDGKGKTTASLGLTLRALGRGFRVLTVMFTKGGNHYGELFALKHFSPKLASNLTVVQAGLDRIVFTHNQKDDDRKKAEAGWTLAKQAIFNEQYDLIILDEANIVIDLGFVALEEVKEVIQKKPEHLELVLTGRRAHPEIIELADLVSEIMPRKHYFDKGVIARKGIEY